MSNGSDSNLGRIEAQCDRVTVDLGLFHFEKVDCPEPNPEVDEGNDDDDDDDDDGDGD